VGAVVGMLRSRKDMGRGEDGEEERREEEDLCTD
jgi:hypothetical protein